MDKRIQGVLTPVVTPFDKNGEVILPQLVNQCRWLQSNNIGLAVFGTNSEANSLSVDERLDILDALVDSGLDTTRMMPGTGACDLPTTVKLTQRAVQRECGGALVLPPFFYKGISEDGLFAFFAELIERVGDERLRLYLYHIPAVTQVPFSLSVVERLLKAYPKQVAGMKDSTGDWTHTQSMLKAFAADGFDVFAGTETILLNTLREGGAGCISATANVNAAAINRLCETFDQSDAEAQQREMNELRSVFQQFPMIPALKAAVSHWSAAPDWRNVRAPLRPLSDAQYRDLIGQLEARDFAIAGLREATAA